MLNGDMWNLGHSYQSFDSQKRACQWTMWNSTRSCFRSCFMFLFFFFFLQNLFSVLNLKILQQLLVVEHALTTNIQRQSTASFSLISNEFPMWVFNAQCKIVTHTVTHTGRYGWFPTKRNGIFGFYHIHPNQNNNKNSNTHRGNKFTSNAFCVYILKNERWFMIIQWRWAHNIVFTAIEANFVCAISRLGSFNLNSATVKKCAWLAVTRHIYMGVCALRNYKIDFTYVNNWNSDRPTIRT